MLFYSYAQLEEATHFLVENYDNQVEIVDKMQGTFFDGQSETTHFYFLNRYLKYRIVEDTVEVLQYEGGERGEGGRGKGWTSEEAVKLEAAFGAGAMSIDQPSACDIFGKEILRPLYIFLFLNVLIQLEVAYYYYCILITLSTIIGVTFTILEVQRVNAQIHEMSFYEVTLHLLRDGSVGPVSSLHIVPGDIVFFSQPLRLPFDGLLLEG